jgi:hypothetical protein
MSGAATGRKKAAGLEMPTAPVSRHEIDCNRRPIGNVFVIFIVNRPS